MEYRRHQDNLGAITRAGEGSGGNATTAPGFGPRGGPPGAGGTWTRNRGDHQFTRQVSWRVKEGVHESSGFVMGGGEGGKSYDMSPLYPHVEDIRWRQSSVMCVHMREALDQCEAKINIIIHRNLEMRTSAVQLEGQWFVAAKPTCARKRASIDGQMDLSACYGSFQQHNAWCEEHLYVVMRVKLGFQKFSPLGRVLRALHGML